MAVKDFFMWLLRMKKEKLDFESTFAMIETTDPAINSFINDKFNKKISIYSSWNAYLNKSPRHSMPFTEADARNIKEVLEIPIIKEDDLNLDFMTTENFGEITTRVRG